MATETITEFEIDFLHLLGLEAEEVLTESGGYSQGFWHNELRIDLEELKAGNEEKAFRVIKDIHDTAGMSFREYSGIDRHAKLPDGVIGQAIATLCGEIWERREELTAGFTTEWNGDWRAVWVVNDEDNTVEDANRYWQEDFKVAVGDLNCAETYDLSYSENFPFVWENVRDRVRALPNMDAHAVQEVLEETYQSDTSTYFLGYADCAEQIVEKLKYEEEG